MKLFFDTLPHEIKMPFQLQCADIATFPLDVRLISGKLRENIDYLLSKTSKIMDLSSRVIQQKIDHGCIFSCLRKYECKLLVAW